MNVDDVVIIENDKALVGSIITILAAEFSLQDLVILNYFSSLLKLFHMNKGFYCLKKSYIFDILSKMGIKTCKPYLL